MAAYRATGAQLWAAQYTALLAEACEIAGETEKSVTLLNDALQIAEGTGERWFTAEVNRLKGHLLLRQGHAEAADELYRTGVAECCVPLEQLMPEAMKVATEIASKSPIGVRYAKQSMNTTMHMPARDGYRFEQGITVMLSKTEDAQEARRAFIEKRKPVFRGR